MDYCSNCGNEIDIYDKFCSRCGEQVKKSSAYQSKTIYNQKEKTTYTHQTNNMSKSMILGVIAIVLSVFNFLTIFVGGFISMVFAILAIATANQEKKQANYSQVGMILGILAIGLNFLIFFLSMGYRLFFNLF